MVDGAGEKGSVTAFASSKNPKEFDPLSPEGQRGKGDGKGGKGEDGKGGGEGHGTLAALARAVAGVAAPPGRAILRRWCAQSDPEACHVDAEELSEHLRRSLKKLSVHRDIDADEAEEEFYTRLRVIQELGPSRKSESALDAVVASNPGSPKFTRGSLVSEVRLPRSPTRTQTSQSGIATRCTTCMHHAPCTMYMRTYATYAPVQGQVVGALTVGSRRGSSSPAKRRTSFGDPTPAQVAAGPATPVTTSVDTPAPAATRPPPAARPVSVPERASRPETVGRPRTEPAVGGLGNDREALLPGASLELGPLA